MLFFFNASISPLTSVLFISHLLDDHFFNILPFPDSNGNEILSYGQGSSVLLGLAGDVNSDSQINILDVVLMVGFAIYIEEPSDAQFWASDINSDNSDIE